MTLLSYILLFILGGGAFFVLIMATLTAYEMWKVLDESSSAEDEDL